ncbi:MAG: zinc-binding dehydrogenase, partial [Hellea sp.]|nr:zinc-binding dehydrogenase [Hellea sp.]
VKAQIAHHCPNKWDVFFDNVGGPILEAALDHINLRSRVVLCGSISGYNSTGPIPGPSNLSNLTINRAKMEGFIVLDYMPRAMEAIQDLMTWITSGQLIYKVDLREGFENIPSTLKRLYTGKNLGKQLLKIDP